MKHFSRAYHDAGRYYFAYACFRSITIYYGTFLLRSAVICIVLCLAVLSFKGWRVYTTAQALRADVTRLESLLAEPLEGEAYASLGPLLAQTRQDAATLRNEAAVFFPITQRLGWLPTYGSYALAAEPLLNLAADATLAADQGFTAFAPLLELPTNGQSRSAAVAQHFAVERPRLETTHHALLRALDQWRRLSDQELPLGVQAPLQRVGLLLAPARDLVDIALAAPDALGVHAKHRYLLIAQNPDELRPTGGLITAAGLLTFEHGELVDVVMSDSTAVNDFTRAAYPPAPDPLARYMGLKLWAFQDSNWSPDFPTSARAAADFYQLGQGQDVDGVIAIDPGAIQLMLAATGPITVEGVDVSADNVVAFMRNAMLFGGPGGGTSQPWWQQRKSFMQPFALALAERISNTTAQELPALGVAITHALDKRHLMLSLEDPTLAELLARRDWDGAVRPGPNDFLMLVDSNLGYNKVTPNVRRAVTYSVDLSHPDSPRAALAVVHTHTHTEPVPCDQTQGYNSIITITRYEEMMVGCFWNYLRVLIPGGSKLLTSQVANTPAAWLLSGVGEGGGAREAIGEAGTTVFDAFFVVPPSKEHIALFHYLLPSTVLRQQGGQWEYQLLLQQQPGVAPLSTTVQIELPPNVRVTSTSLQPTQQKGQTLSFTVLLDQDQELSVMFEDNE
jgi:hypothetical protein